MAVYDSIDLFWSWDGDFDTGPDGDIRDTSYDYLASLIQEIHTVVKSEIGDWENDPMVGATLSDFLGEPNTKENGRRLEDRVRTKLIEAQVVRAEDVAVRVVPINIHQVMIMINVMVAVTANNHLQIGDKVNINILYDTMENGLFFMPDTVVKE